jgi:hypothetical protein
VANSATGEHEERTRVICHLPLNSAAEEKAFKEVVAYVEAQREKKIGVEGYTYSDPKAFFGRWWSVDNTWVSDKIVLLIIDYKIALTDPHASLSEMIRELKDTVHQSYAKYGRAQEEVWIVAFGVTRHR